MSIELEEKARNASSVISPSELHGLTCGMAAGNPGKFSLPAFIRLAGEDSLTDEHAVTDFVTQALHGFASQDMEFSPLVADDNAPMPVRLAGLSEWCAGFLSGFGAAVKRGEDGAPGQLPEDVQEIIRDFVSISSLSGDEEDEPGEEEQDEASYMEIFEYTRVAAVLVLALMTGEDPDPGESSQTNPH